MGHKKNIRKNWLKLLVDINLNTKENYEGFKMKVIRSDEPDEKSILERDIDK